MLFFMINLVVLIISHVGGGLIQHKCIFSKIMSDRVGALCLSDTVNMKLMNTPFYHFMEAGALVVAS